MGQASSIEWTDATWNPVVGCTKVSPGCKNCYAKTLHDMRHTAHAAGEKVPAQYARPFEVVQLLPQRFRDPWSLRQPKRVFVNSMSDLFHEDVPDDFLDHVFAAMAMAPWHTFQVLTKRPGRMLAYLTSDRTPAGIADAACVLTHDRRNPGRVDDAFAERLMWMPDGDKLRPHGVKPWPVPNVWLGVSVEDQQRADERIPLLLRTQAAVRFLSCEPLLGPVILHKYFAQCRCGHGHGFTACPNTGGVAKTCEASDCRELRPLLDWVIVGGESGRGARPMLLEWAESLRDQCAAAGVACFVKQLGAHPRRLTGLGVAEVVTLRDRKGGDPGEWPEDLRVRQYPEAARA